MFFILSKLLDFLLKPIIWVLAMLVLAIWSRNTLRRKQLLIAVTTILFVFTNPFLSNEAWRWWEVPPTPIGQVAYHDVGIILTGFTDGNQLLRDRVFTNKGADRVLHAITLFRKGKIGCFLISGGEGSVLTTLRAEADDIRQILLEAHIPDSLILVENKSRNTYENARFTAQLLRRHPRLQKRLLITSAFHMRRAKGCFDQAGVNTTVFAADFYGRPRSFNPDKWLVPREESLAQWRILIHEWTGYLVYLFRGYL